MRASNRAENKLAILRLFFQDATQLHEFKSQLHFSKVSIEFFFIAHQSAVQLHDAPPRICRIFFHLHLDQNASTAQKHDVSICNITCFSQAWINLGTENLT